MNKKFPVLSIVSIVLRFLGVIIFLLGFYISLNSLMGGLIIPMSQHTLITNKMDVQINILIGSITILFGLALIAIGEIIGVIFAIEENTHDSLEVLQRLSENLTTSKIEKEKQK